MFTLLPMVVPTLRSPLASVVTDRQKWPLEHVALIPNCMWTTPDVQSSLPRECQGESCGNSFQPSGSHTTLRVCQIGAACFHIGLCSNLPCSFIQQANSEMFPRSSLLLFASLGAPPDFKFVKIKPLRCNGRQIIFPNYSFRKLGL
jgi:hypothetical protein